MIAALALLALSAATPHAADTRSFDQLSQQAAAARQANRDDEAISLYRAALDKQPSWKEGLWFLGTLLYQKEQYPEARDAMRRFVVLEHDAGPGWLLLGMSEYHAREYARSLDHLRRGLSLGSGGRQDMANSAFYLVGALLTRYEDFDTSADLLLSLARPGNPSPALVTALGLAVLRLPMLPSEIPPDRVDVVRMAGAGAAALAAQRNAEAEKAFRDLAARYPSEPGVHFLLGAFLMDNRTDEGLAEMRRELAITPDHVPARIRLAIEYTAENKLDLALPFAQQAVALDPKSAAAHRALGKVLLAKGDAPGAILELETAREQSPDVLDTHWALMRAYSAAGRTADADKEKAQLERLKPQVAK